VRGTNFPRYCKRLNHSQFVVWRLFLDGLNLIFLAIFGNLVNSWALLAVQAAVTVIEYV
jgi:hypothetical protein